MQHSEYFVNKLWTYLPKKMSSGRWVWWDEYYLVEDTTNVDPRHMLVRTTLYTKEEWFIRKLSGNDTPAGPAAPRPTGWGLGY